MCFFVLSWIRKTLHSEHLSSTIAQKLRRYGWKINTRTLESLESLPKTLCLLVQMKISIPLLLQLLLFISLAFCDDLSLYQCTSSDVIVIGPGTVLNEPCPCNGVFNATVRFLVQNNAASPRSCVTLHLCNSTTGIYPGIDVPLLGYEGKEEETLSFFFFFSCWSVFSSSYSSVFFLERMLMVRLLKCTSTLRFLTILVVLIWPALVIRSLVEREAARLAAAIRSAGAFLVKIPTAT